MKRMLAIVLALLLIGAASAEVIVKGSVNLRSGPGLEYDSLTVVPGGEVLNDCYEISTDSRGVDWYCVDYDGWNGWISSRFAELSEESQAPSVDLTDLDSFVELSGYCLTDLDAAAEALGLKDFRELNSEAPRRYSSDALTLGGHAGVEYFNLVGSGYTLFGVAPGMTLAEAGEKLEAAGLAYFSDACYQRPAGPDFPVNVDGMDSRVNLWTRDDIVVALDWCAYAG